MTTPKEIITQRGLRLVACCRCGELWNVSALMGTPVAAYQCPKCRNTAYRAAK